MELDQSSRLWQFLLYGFADHTMVCHALVMYTGSGARQTLMESITTDVEEKVRNRRRCMMHKTAPTRAPLIDIQCCGGKIA